MDSQTNLLIISTITMVIVLLNFILNKKTESNQDKMRNVSNTTKYSCKENTCIENDDTGEFSSLESCHKYCGKTKDDSDDENVVRHEIMYVPSGMYRYDPYYYPQSMYYPYYHHRDRDYNFRLGRAHRDDHHRRR